jgi:hypothetical protein
MSYWRLMDYHLESGVSPVRQWYGEYDDGLCAEMDYALYAQTQDRDWDSPQVCILQEPFPGLIEICVDMEIDDETTQFRVIGSFRLEGNDVILFQISEKRGKVYDPPLEQALAHKLAFEKQKRGAIYEHQFFQD